MVPLKVTAIGDCEGSHVSLRSGNYTGIDIGGKIG